MGSYTVSCLSYYSQGKRTGRYCTPAFSFLWAWLFLGFSSNANGQANVKVRSIDFDGNHVISANQLTAALSMKSGAIFSETALTNDMEHILSLYKNQAYLHTRIDSIQERRDTAQQEIELHIFLTEGKQSILRHLEIIGCQTITSDEFSHGMQLHEGDPFVPSLLEEDIHDLLQHYERRGYPLSKVAVQNITFRDSVSEMSVSVQLRIDEGKELHVSEIRIEGNKTTKEYVIMRESRLKENELYRSDLPDLIKRRLDHLQLFSSVSLPELYLTDKGQAGLLVRVVEGNQNNFDGVLGYVPATPSGGSSYLTGLIDISLRNLFGTGRKLSARWFQENKTSQETELHYFEPWIASYPINAQLGFFQRKQDSTYVRMQYDISADFMITEEFSIGASFSQNNVYPTTRYDGRKTMAESKSIGFGASVRYDSRDNLSSPTKGILYSTEYQTGTKQTFTSTDFPVGYTSSTRRVVFDLSYYLSPFMRQVIASELHLRDFSSDHADISDLFRIGGATTLRGYREGFFLGSRLVWTNMEYRFLVSPRSYFYGFVDIGYIIQPAFASSNGEQSEQSKIGYGIGVRMDSALGLIGVSFALGEGDTFSTSKIHIRLINEF
jgi:outer membrane protein assembly complex protein YaeT